MLAENREGGSHETVSNNSDQATAMMSADP
jgi:hypothetical protein